jgi:hypothetical protein
VLFIYLSIDVFICLHTPSAHIHPIPVYHCFCIPCMFYFVFIVCAYIREKERKSIHPSTLCSGAAKPSLFSRRLGDTLLVLVLLLTPRPLTPPPGCLPFRSLYAPLSLRAIILVLHISPPLLSSLCAPLCVSTLIHSIVNLIYLLERHTCCTSSL